jgi:hypothetical protein
MEGWINCNKCNNRFRAFIQFCPQCGSQNPAYNNDIHHSSVEFKKNKVSVRKTAIIIVVVVAIIGVVVAWNISTTKNNDNNNNSIFTNQFHYHILKPKPLDLEKQSKFEVNDNDNNNLRQYALKKINEDRVKFNLSPVELSQNKAAQIHAEELLKTRMVSHRTTDGMKPYMRYSIYNGTGYMVQNIEAGGYDNTTLNKCKNHILLLCAKINPYKEIDVSEWNMIYNDTICCGNGHKHNILGKYHTHVSIGIAYDNTYFAIVQNFENNYIKFDKSFLQDDNNNNNNDKHIIIQMSGTLLKSNTYFDNIEVFYDETPTPLVYRQHKDDMSYTLGEFIATIVKPPPLFSYYKQPSGYTLIQADKLLTNGQSFDIRFDFSPVLKMEGVYTIVVYVEDDNKNLFPASSYSIFVK